jgi:hypothetical protein
MSKENSLTIKQLFSESVILNLILFGILFLITLGQDWTKIFLFLFSFITLSFSMFFKLIEVNKWRTRFEDSPIVYNPFGSEERNATRFNFSALLQLIFLFWIGAESLYHPQLIIEYGYYFNLIFLFLYTFAFFWIFFDIWKYSHIKISLTEQNEKTAEEEKSYEEIIQFLKVRNFRFVSYINLTIFLALNGLNLLFTWLTYKGAIPGIFLELPGTGIEFSDPLLINYLFLPILIISPAYSIPLLVIIYRDINTLKKKDLRGILSNFSKNMRILVLENFLSLNKKLLEDIDIDQLIEELEAEVAVKDHIPRPKRKKKAKIELIEKKKKEKQSEKDIPKKREITRKEEKKLKKEEKEKKEIREKIKAPFMKKKEEKVKVISKKYESAQKLRKELKDEMEELVEKNEEHKKWVKKAKADNILVIEKSDGRRGCPNCGEDRKKMIHESIDKHNIISSYPRIYGKKYKCGKCGTQWREK